MTQCLRWSGVASILGGLTFPFYLLLHPTQNEGGMHSASYAAIQVLASISLLLLLVGLLGIYAVQAKMTQTLGRISFLFTFLATILEMVYVVLDGFMNPLSITSMSFIGVIFTLGYMIFAVVTFSAHVFPRWGAVFLLAGALLFSPQTMVPSCVESLGGAMLGVGFIEMGYRLLFFNHSAVEWWYGTICMEDKRQGFSTCGADQCRTQSFGSFSI